MRHYDLTPLYRSTVGFDRVFKALENLANLDNDTGYPPYNIERLGENAYRISMAVAGFAETDLAAEVRDGVLTVRGERKADASEATAVLHRGIAARAFERRFQLADHVTVTGASLRHGLLHVDLVRELPEAKRPRTIPIRAADTAADTDVAISAPTVIDADSTKAA